MTLEDRQKIVAQVVPEVAARACIAISDVTGLKENYAVMVMLEFIVYSLMHRAPIETEEYLTGLVEMTKKATQDDPVFLEKRQELFDILELVTAR